MAKQNLSCFDAALKMLAQRDYAVKEMAGKLKDKGYQGIEIAQTIDSLQEKGWLNDAKFACHRARYRAETSRWGASRIRLELKQKGVVELLIEAALTELASPAEGDSHDFQETASELVMRRFGPLSHSPEPADFGERQIWLKQREKDKKRRLDFLLRRGFSMQEALTALADLSSS